MLPAAAWKVRVLPLSNVIALITARGGSKGIPGKNIKMLAGKPLIAWTIEAARASRSLSRVIASTDDAGIADVARKWGADVPYMRPAELAGDSCSQVEVVEHMLKWLRDRERICPDYVLLLQPTSPLRTSGDIEAVVELALRQKARAVVGVCEPEHHPFALKQLTAAGALVDFMPSGLGYVRRQDYPPIYAVNGAIYLVEPAVILQERTFEPSDARPYMMPRERSLDIDTLQDFELADLILSRKAR